jgi:bifunctional non-homologous end joining protein LigD
VFFKAAAELGLEGIVSKRATSLYPSGPSKNWLKTKNMVVAREQDGELEFAGQAILRPPSAARAVWAGKFAALSIEKPALKGMRRGKARWLKPEIRVRAQYLKAREHLGMRRSRRC